MQWSKKQKFSEYIVLFQIYASNFEHFEIKDDPHSLSVSAIKDSERSI